MTMLSPWFLALVVVSQADAPKVEWKPFRSPQGKFAISMPRGPSEKKRILAVGGKTIDLVATTARKDQAAYAAAYAVLDGANPEAAIKSAQADAVAQSKGELKDDHEVMLGKVAGRELSIEIPRKVMAGGGVTTVRIFALNGRVVALSATVPTAKAEALADEVASFFDSFRPEGLELPTAEPKPKVASGAAGTGKAKPATTKSTASAKGMDAKGKAAGSGSAPPEAAKPAPARLVEFSSPDRLYVVKMPAAPMERTENHGTMMGPVETKFFHAKLGDTVFLVSSEKAVGHDLSNPTSADMILGIQKKVDVEVRKFVVKSERRLVLGEAPGLELEVEAPADSREYPGGASVIRRMFLVGPMSYTVMASTPKSGRPSSEVAEFLDSFEVVLANGKKTGRAVARNLAWALFSPETAEFTVLMPGKPGQRTQKALNAAGENKMTLYSAEVDDRHFAVECQEFSGNILSGQTGPALLKALSEIERKLGGGVTLKSSKEIQVSGKPGREEILDVAGIGRMTPTTKVRRFVLDAANGRIYSVGVVGPVGCQDEKVVQDFLQSFKLK